MPNVIEAITQAVRGVFGGADEAAPASGFKALGDHWFAFWSNSFEDRDGEWFAEKAIDEYVMRVDVGAVPYPELWFWHTPGTRFGEAQWVGRVGHFAIAAGAFDETPLGHAMQEAFAKGRGLDYGMSHGFVYDPGQKRGDVYHQFNTFELSVLPAEVAANSFTAFEEVKAMELTPEKTAALKRMIGPEMTDKLLAETENKSRLIEELGVRYKDFVRMTDAKAEGEDPEAEVPPAPMPEDDELAKEGLAAMVEEFIGQIGALYEMSTGLLDRVRAVEQSGTDMEAGMETEMASLRKDTAAARKEIAELRARLDDAPRSASRGEAPEASPALVKEAAQTEANESLRKTFPGLFNS